uniref:Coiled-coil domain-containing protein n=1 Tax=Loa loa TaxID=7209 RepID=A0A1I7VAK9_LOALO
MSDSSTLRSSPTRTHRSSRLSTIGSEANDKKRSIRGRRSSMSVKEVIDGVEITKDVIIGDDISKVNEKNSSLLSIKMAAIEEEEKHLMNYIKKLQNEKEEWDKMLQNYEKSVVVAKNEVNKPIMLSSKHIEEVRVEYMGTRDTPSSVEIALAMKPFLRKKAELQISQNQKLRAEVEAAEKRFRRLQELIKIRRSI